MAYRINPAAGQQVAFNSSTSTKTGVVVGSSVIVLYATKDCFVNLSSNPTAAATGAGNIFVPAQTYLELDIATNRNWYVAAIGASESGTLYINEVTK